MSAVKKIIYSIQKYELRKYWRKKNSHNFTTLGIISNSNFIDFIKKGGCIVGKNTYGRLNLNYSGGIDEQISIGSNCSIAGSANFLLGGEHDYSRITTYPYAYRIFNFENDVKSKGKIIIDDEVWIGDGVWILSGVHIGKGAIIGTGSVVTKNIPPYAIAAGNPARVIKFRFTDDVIKKIINIDLTSYFLSPESIDYLNTPLDSDNVDEILTKLEEYHE